jgi:hypothetical protein
VMNARYRLVNNRNGGCRSRTALASVRGDRIPHPELVKLYGCDWRRKLDRRIRRNSVRCECGVPWQNIIALLHLGRLTIEDEVSVGTALVSINDRFPRAATETGELRQRRDLKLEPTPVCRKDLKSVHV